MRNDPLIPRWLVRVLLPLSLVAAVALALLVRTTFTGEFLEEPEDVAAGPSPAPAVSAPERPPPPPSRPRQGASGAEEALELDHSRRQEAARRTLWRRLAEPDTFVPARVRARMEEVRRLQGRYRQLEREVRAEGGIESPEAQDALRELERTARELRRAEADLDRARRARR